MILDPTKEELRRAAAQLALSYIQRTNAWKDSPENFASAFDELWLQMYRRLLANHRMEV